MAAHDRHEGHTIGMFRRRFWIALLFTIPTLVWSDMIQRWFHFNAPSFPGATSFLRFSALPCTYTAVRFS